MAEYGVPSFRKSRKEKKLKRRHRIYKRGGKHRGIKLKFLLLNRVKFCLMALVKFKYHS